MTPRDRVLIETSRAQGVIMTMGALLRDIGIGSLVENGETTMQDDIVSRSVHGLSDVAQLWDGNPEAGDNHE